MALGCHMTTIGTVQPSSHVLSELRYAQKCMSYERQCATSISLMTASYLPITPSISQLNGRKPKRQASSWNVMRCQPGSWPAATACRPLAVLQASCSLADGSSRVPCLACPMPVIQSACANLKAVLTARHLNCCCSRNIKDRVLMIALKLCMPPRLWAAHTQRRRALHAPHGLSLAVCGWLLPVIM